MTQPDEPRSGAVSPRAGRRALVWSFFVPPAGLVLGLIALRRLPDSEANRSARTEARLATLNGVASTLIIAKLIWVLVHLRSWIDGWLYGGAPM